MGFFYWQYLKTSAERSSLTLKLLAKDLPLSRPCTISFLALAEETVAAFGCCYFSTPRAFHLGVCQAEAVISPGWREPPVCGKFGAGAAVSILIPFPSGGLGEERRKTGFAKRRAPGFGRLQRKQEKKLMLLFRSYDAY